MLDYLIINATICTGLKQKAVIQPVGILGNKIVLFDPDTELPEAKETIDGGGRILSPGFIDPHASTGFGYFFPNAADHKLYQGITTEIFGNCGTSPAPIGENLKPTMERLSGEIGFPFNWTSLEEYFKAIKDNLQFNIATLIGHSTLRGGNLEDWKVLKDQELEAMKSSLREALEQGGIGFSTGLIYPPGCFAETKEIVELAKIAAEKDGVYASHIRDERDKVEEAVEEALTVCKGANIRTLVSHLKAAEKQNWGKIPKILKELEKFNEENPENEVAIDVYPYTAISTKMRAFIPKYILKDGIKEIKEKLQQDEVVKSIADWIVSRDYDLSQMLVISKENKDFAGKDVRQIAKEQGLSEAETVARILMDNTEAWIVYHCIDQEDIDAAILWEKAMVCTDSWSYPINAPTTIGEPHPRSYGAFTEYLQRYVKELKALSWEEAVHKITYLPAQFFKLEGRGQITTDYYADLVLLNPETLKVNATYTEPRSLSEGVEFLWVNGEMVIENKTVKPVNPGKILTHH
ncbi:amidohydrolase family protein [Aureitalea sp. L0-47]|uniref:N-acyl-D-amino-acid deacylase family protein n=1 Tax=Aureitalea sp. L0-47 TaxID=2816962 RepID=UPI0022385B29|nr:amidohydrolase family protein [Aureitalea sp. L0-47]MCW5519849.1 amidohydrolase family protein [Aureitalea sp. L0-47]